MWRDQGPALRVSSPLALHRGWFARNSMTSDDWSAASLLDLKCATAHGISVVIPARDEQATVGAVVSTIRRELIERVPLVDEIVVMDSLSRDDTAAVAAEAGARVWSVADVRPDLGVRPGKGEALWKSLFVTSGDLLVFIDADLTEWGSHFVSGLLGPLLTRPEIQLVKGFYDRILDEGECRQSLEGGRVTELVARPLLAMWWPALSGVVQPLAGEWAVRRQLFASLTVPSGYGVELATLLDTYVSLGTAAIAQVDLGRRAHRHQSVHDLAAMAVEILAVADARRARSQRPRSDQVELAQFDRATGGWRRRLVDNAERPPVSSYGRSA
jgi:glucosyl-3-phosphoglycerate synthase